MATAQDFDGQFWLQGSDFDRQAGVLRVGPDLTPSVGTVSPLISPWREIRRTEHPDGLITVTQGFAEEELTTPVTIHGLDGQGTPLTLLSATTTHWERPDAAGHTHHFRGIQAVVGGHLRGRDHLFTGFRIRLGNLDAWRPRLQQPQWTAEVPLASGGTMDVQDLPVPSSATDRSALWLTGEGLPPATLRTIGGHFIQPLFSLFTLATDRSCSPLALQVQEDSPEGPWWDVYSAALQADDGAPNLRWELPLWLLQPGDLGLREIGAWLDQAGTLGPMPAVVADLAQASSISLDTQALLLATVAEGLHRCLYPDEVRFDQQTAERVKATAAEAVNSIHEKAKETVRGFLSHVEEVGYGARLTGLAAVAEDVAPGITGHTSGWKNLVYKVRNLYAHRFDSSFLDDGDIDDRLTVAVSLRWLLTIILLLQAGVDASVLRSRLADHEQYQRFLADAQIWRPDIYKLVAKD